MQWHPFVLGVLVDGRIMQIAQSCVVLAASGWRKQVAGKLFASI
jgi:hypothetical protein